MLQNYDNYTYNYIYKHFNHVFDIANKIPYNKDCTTVHNHQDVFFRRKGMASTGVYKTKKKNGAVSYRSSLTYRNKHISLGSFSSENAAHSAYLEAMGLLSGTKEIREYESCSPLPFEKWVVLINFRDNGLYVKTPIYMEKKYFHYYYSPDICYKFDVDDLFYYSTHKIMKRGGHLFVSDFGMQVNILSRYGIRNFAVPGRDYLFVNGDSTDFRYGNIEIQNRYYGVRSYHKNGITRYITKIHIKGDIIVGRYATENEAAIAYNKAVDYVKARGCTKNFPENYLMDMKAGEYERIYEAVSFLPSFIKGTA